MLLEALTRLGATRHETVYIGDMVVDIETARAAGVPVWVIPTGCDSAANAWRPKPTKRHVSITDFIVEPLL